MRVIMAGLSDVGRRRKSNQDSIFFDDIQGLGIVCDGIGGRAGGDVASAFAVEGMKQVFLESDRIKHEEIAAFLMTAVDRLNRGIAQRGAIEGPERGMGTTLNCLLFAGDRLHIAHVGDSRTYLYLQGNIWQLTVDHNVKEGKKRGLFYGLDPTQFKDAKDAALTRALGLQERVDVDIYDIGLEVGQIFLTCSDGLTGMVDDSGIAKIIKQYENKLELLPKALIDAANAAGGVDNITVLVSQVRN